MSLLVNYLISYQSYHIHALLLIYQSIYLHLTSKLMATSWPILSHRSSSFFCSSIFTITSLLIMYYVCCCIDESHLYQDQERYESVICSRASHTSNSFRCCPCRLFIKYSIQLIEVSISYKIGFATTCLHRYIHIHLNPPPPSRTKGIPNP